MSTDRELLELAATAAKLRLWKRGEVWRETVSATGLLLESGIYVWNPLTDDGDALRLAVNLGLRIDTPSGYGRDAVAYGGDPMASTRRAIVLAAAEIGRAVQ